MSTLARLLLYAAAALLAVSVAAAALAGAPRPGPGDAGAGRLSAEALASLDRAAAAQGAAREAHLQRLRHLEEALRACEVPAGDAVLAGALRRLPAGRELAPEHRAALEAVRDAARTASPATAVAAKFGPEAVAAASRAAAAGALGALALGLLTLRRAERRGAEERRRLADLLPEAGGAGDIGERVARLRGRADRLAELSHRAVIGRLSLAEAMTSYEAAQERLHAAQDELSERLRGASVEIERLKVSSMLDELTGALKYPYLVHRTKDLLRSLLEDGRPFCLLGLDLDNFKDINDTYGHAAGDDALREFARVLRASSREGDLVIRKSGDEFFVLAPGARLEDALALGERLRGAVNAHMVVSTTAAGDRYEFPLCVSVGVLDASHADVAALRSITDDDMAVREVLSYVDAALYRAKHAGKNCVRGYEAGLRVVDLRRADAPPDLARVNRLAPGRYAHLAPEARARFDALLGEASELLFPKRRGAGE